MIRFSNRLGGSGQVAQAPVTSNEMMSITGPMSSPLHHQSSMGSPPMANQNMGSPFYDDASVSPDVESNH